MARRSISSGATILALEHLNKKQQVVVKKFLEELLTRNPSGAELQQIWHAAGPDYDFPDDEHLRGMLTLIRDMSQ
jgi:hypothetical protein